ncbi:hypothetical protein AN641_03745 [Candidatus Epulonipiscioides gigas]|nr:hypothetical protein AN641_03745 [Epulopiscium sp. SCG-C07WGA-EpuloA2]
MYDKANQHIAQTVTNDKYRPKYHISSPVGWINDPNGLIFYKGEYHAFYQYYPYDTIWGPMHWGHAKSKDLIKWEYLPVALAPDMEYEKIGCFSGSAIEQDGKLYLVYTGASENEQGQHVQTQCIAYSDDGINFKKYEGNPVLSADDLPEDCRANIGEFRDPKVFKHGEHFYMVVVAKSCETAGNILLYKSDDLLKWDYVNSLVQGDKDNFGVMFECPDLFSLNYTDILITSPIDINRKGHRFSNTSSTLYFSGNVNLKTGEYDYNHYDEIDIGTDFYAPQTLFDNKERRIMIAWAQMWKRTMPTNVLKHNWSGSFSIPRKLSVKNDKLIQVPVEELKQYRKNHVHYENEHIKDVREFDGVYGDVCELIVNANINQTNNFAISLLKTDNEHFVIHVDKENHKIVVDRSCIGDTILGNERIPVNFRWIPYFDENVKLNILIDKSLIEIFVNDGEYAMTFTAYKKGNDAKIEFFADGNAIIDIDKWDIGIE